METKNQKHEIILNFDKTKAALEKLKSKTYKYHATKPIKGIGFIPKMNFEEITDANNKITLYSNNVLNLSNEFGFHDKNNQIIIDGFTIQNIKDDFNTRMEELYDKNEIRDSIATMKNICKYILSQYDIKMEDINYLLDCDCNQEKEQPTISEMTDDIKEEVRRLKEDINTLLYFKYSELMKKEQPKEQRTIREIAIEIKDVWKNIYFGAVPYLNVMLQLKTVNDYYGLDSAINIINYFLANATYWRGEDARRIKKELNELLKNS